MKKVDKFETNSQVYKRVHWEEICDKTGKCTFCPKHAIENRRRRPRSDKYKNKR